MSAAEARYECTYFLQRWYDRHAAVYMAVYGDEPQADAVSGASPGQLALQTRCRHLFDAYHQMLTLIYAAGEQDAYLHFVSVFSTISVRGP
jgi:hypothetical protein